MLNYEDLIKRYDIRSIKELNELFWEEIAFEWIEAYEKMSDHGVITLQNFYGYAFIIDDGNQFISKDMPAKELLESRVVGAFGISDTKVNKGNRNMMRKWIGKTTEVFSPYGNNYDKGHFIAHGFGGPVDVNLFPQRSDINRGHKPEGTAYREMERFVAANPGTFVFSRPIYNDLSFCPCKLEYGYCDVALNFIVREFPNR